MYKKHHDREDLIPGIQGWFNIGKPMIATHDNNRLKKARKPHYHFPQMHKSMARSNRIVQIEASERCCKAQGLPRGMRGLHVVINLHQAQGPTLRAPRYSLRVASVLAVPSEGPLPQAARLLPLEASKPCLCLLH